MNIQDKVAIGAGTFLLGGGALWWYLNREAASQAENVDIISVTTAPTDADFNELEFATPGGYIAATIEWENLGNEAYSPEFRLDLRPAGFAKTWVEGSFIKADEVEPGETGFASIYCKVPEDWLETTIDIKVVLKDIKDPVWEKDDVYTTEAIAEFSDLKSTTFDGIWPEVPARILFAGSTFEVILRFEYDGPFPYTVWLGAGLAYSGSIEKQPPFYYAKEKSVLEAPGYYDITISGIVPSNIPVGKTLDVQVFISDTEPVPGQQPPNDYGVNEWFDDVYTTEAIKDAFSNIIKCSEMKFNNLSQSMWPVPIKNGESWWAYIEFDYTGPSGKFDIGMCAHFGEQYYWAKRWPYTLPDCDKPTRQSVKVQGIWDAPAGFEGDSISVEIAIGPENSLPFGNTYESKCDIKATYGAYFAQHCGNPDPYRCETGALLGVLLTPGQNNVAYGGPTQPVEAAAAQLVQAGVLNDIWVYRSGKWYLYDPDDPIGSDLEQLIMGEALWVDVSSEIFWEW